MSLHDRPEKMILGSYVYLIEYAGDGYAAYRKIADMEGMGFPYYGVFQVK